MQQGLLNPDIAAKPDRTFAVALAVFPFSIAYMLGIFLPPPEEGEARRRFTFNINSLNGFFLMKGPNLSGDLEVDRRMAARRARVNAARKRQPEDV